MARKCKYGTAEELQKAIDKYFDKAAEEDIMPDLAGMLIFLGYKSERTMKNQIKDKPDYAEVWEYAKLRRTSWLQRRMDKNPKGATAYAFMLKQPENGGFIDKPVDSGEKKVTIEFTSGKGAIEASDFK